MDVKNNMANRIALYCKQAGEPPTPVTARIEWLPDGTIKPLMYWMPDGSCFRVKLTHECTPIALLKDRGEGLRFKVRAELIETPEYDGGLLCAQQETYLYLADNRFCGKNFIDARYGHAGKEYISVTLDILPDNEYEIIYFRVQGARYMVEKTRRIEPRASFRAGGVGICHIVEARQINNDDDEDFDPSKNSRRTAALFFEVNKWFVASEAL